jgi:RnfABCDGE-type electron transport complex B subunit
MDTIITAIISIAAIGAVCAVILSLASKFMAVKIDERVAKIQECLPGSNCGACGYPGCSSYAEALISGTKTNLCTPGGADVLQKINDILGGDNTDSAFEEKTAVINCRGDLSAQQIKMDYKAIKTCAAAKQIFGGERACAFGCLGYGDCKIACPSDAVCIESGLAKINKNCTGCALCVKACPNNLISIEKKSVPVVILCKNIEKGAVARKKCSNCCLGCGRCVRECPDGAITLTDNLAKIDYEKCTDCGHCAEVCIAKCIQVYNTK